MKKDSFVLNVLMAGLIVVGSVGLGHAGDLKVSGFADILWWLGNDQPTVDPTGPGAKNAIEQKFLAKAEIDFEKEQDGVTFRLDLDFPAAGASVLGCNQGVNGLVGCVSSTFGDSIEQAKFDWAIPGAPMGLNLTGGVFNSPIGWESQDAPDRQFTTYGQLYGLVPSNMAGIVLGVNQGPFSASVIYADEWRTVVTPEENSFGVTLAFNPQPLFGISVGFLTSDVTPAGPPATATTNQDGDLIDVIVSGVSPLGAGAELNYALEYLTDDNNDAIALTVGATHGKHALTIRYDSVDCGKKSAFCAGGTGLASAAKTRKPTSITVSASCELASTLTARLEYVTYDSDVTVVAPALAPDADLLMLQFVATFN